MKNSKRSRNYNQGKFVNQISTSIDTRVGTMLSILRDYIKGNPKLRPADPIPVQPIEPRFFKDNKQSKVVWFGHSTLLMKLDGKTILLDPMFGKGLSPVEFFGGKRYSEKLPVEVEEIDAIDTILISHNHYDHLDYATIKKLSDKVKRFFVPLGVGRQLGRWGVAPEKIKELDWWNEVEVDGLTLACTPARHFSGRGICDRDATLWCSWVIAGQHTKVYFSGDSGYGPHFAEIGNKYGPFDLTFMECGQYDERWSAIHMMPEETVQAQLDVQGKRMIPIHWGAFTLALHDWDDPVERVVKAAKAKGICISTPKIGETVIIGSEECPDSTWWRNCSQGLCYFKSKVAD